MQTFSAKMPNSAVTSQFTRERTQKEHGKSMESFQDCITFHLLDMFPGNAAKQQHFHMSNMLKKPQ
jgi:hypothetical protein